MFYKITFIIRSITSSIICKYFGVFGLKYPHNSTSIIKICKKKKEVTKEILLYNKYNVVDNEVKWLKKLHSLDFTPNFISRRNNVITLSYAGQNIDKNNLPSNWESQLENIAQELDRMDCSHNDIKPSDLLLLDGKIMLIDFQWATNINDPIPKNWPKYIGRKYNSSNKGYNNSISLKNCVLDIMKLK